MMVALLFKAIRLGNSDCEFSISDKSTRPILMLFL